MEGVEPAPVGREEHDGFADDRRVEAESAVATDSVVSGSGADVARRVDLEARPVIEVVLVDPLLGERRISLALREPGKLHLELVVLDSDGLHLATEHVALVLVLDFHLTADESRDCLRCQLHDLSPFGCGTCLF